MKKAILFAFIIYHAAFIICSAQHTNLPDRQADIDSLWGVWNDNTFPDTTQLMAMNKIAWIGYLFSQPDSAFYFAQIQYDLAEKKGLKKYMALALNTQGVSIKLRGEFPKALHYFHRCLKIFDEIDDKKGLANILSNMGVIYSTQGDYSKALDYYQKSLKMHEEMGHKIGIARVLINIGNIYADQSNDPKSLEYYQLGLKMAEEIGNKLVIANALGNIGIIYADQNDYPKALEYYQRSLKIAEEIDDKWGMAMGLGYIGIVYAAQSDYTKALEYYKSSLKISEEISDKEGITNALRGIGRVNQAQSNFEDALIQCQKSLEISEEIGSLERQKDACSCLYDTYKDMGKGNEALVYLEKLQVINERLHAEETGQKLQQMEFAKIMLQDSIAQAETDRLVQEAHQEEVRKSTQTRNYLIGGGFFFLLLAGGVYSRLRYIRKSKAIVEKEKDRSNNLLLNILPADIAEELKIHGKAEARDFDLVSILFTDFKGFTEQSAKMSAADLVKEINVCFEAFDGIVSKYNVEKIKTIGDSYMAAGGLPVPTDDSVKNTMLAALAMQEFIIARHKAQVASGLPAFEMRLGIHTGPVVAGIVGLKKFQYDIWGDTVNTASRMESAGEVGKVNISQATYEILKGDPEFSFESRGKIEAKGKGEIEMYFIGIKGLNSEKLF